MNIDGVVNKYLREYHRWLRKNKLEDNVFNWFQYNDLFMNKINNHEKYSKPKKEI